MTEFPLPADFSATPVGVWHPDESGNIWWRARPDSWEWAREHIRDCNRTMRAEFYLLDMPFAVLYRVVFTGGPAIEEPPVICLLDELPPDWMLSEEAWMRKELSRA